jgi:hypothetical protein
MGHHIGKMHGFGEKVVRLLLAKSHKVWWTLAFEP